MSGTTMSRYGLAALVCGLLWSAVVMGQTQPPIQGDIKRSSSDAEAFCKANLSSAPSDLKLGEVDAFCSCIGAQEAAMAGVPEEVKASLVPRHQQMCVEIVRKQETKLSTPSAPLASSPESRTQPSVNSDAAATSPVQEKIGQWTIATNAAGAPVAFSPALDASVVEAFTMYCRTKDSIGLRVKFKPGSGVKEISFPIAGWDIPLVIGQNGLATQASWAEFVKSWLQEDKIIANDRKLPEYSGVRDFTSGLRIIGKANLDDLTKARESLRRMCGVSIAGGIAPGNYLLTGISGFSEEVLAAPTIGGPSARNAVAIPRSKPPPTVDCAVRIKRELASAHAQRSQRMARGQIPMDEFERRVCRYGPEYMRRIEGAVRAMEACPSFVRTKTDNPDSLRSFMRSYREGMSAFRC